jgi:hypothetical protein
MRASRTRALWSSTTGLSGALPHRFMWHGRYTHDCSLGPSSPRAFVARSQGTPS